jgi:hypothetical protein
MSAIEPVVRQMLLCDEVSRDADTPNKLNILGLRHAIRLAPEETFPFLLQQLTLYLLLAGGRGEGAVSVAGVVEEDDVKVFETRPRTVDFGQDPLHAQGLIFRVKDVIFPRPAVYSIQFLCGGKVLDHQPLIVR